MNTAMLDLYYEYRHTLSHLYAAHKKYHDQGDGQKVSLVNGMINDVHFAITCIEEYLPSERRIYTQEKLKSYKMRPERIHLDDMDELPANNPVAEFKIPEEFWCDVEFHKQLHEVLDTICNDRQLYLLTAYYMYGMNEQKIAKKMNMTQQNVSYHIKAILKKIRKSDLFLSLFV